MSTEHKYEVMRHGGRRTDKPRTVWGGDELAQAEAEYHKHWVSFRQGAVALIDNANKKILKQDSVGCWRTNPGA